MVTTIKTIKKALTMIVILSLLFTFVPVTFAEDTITYSIEGDATLFAPPIGSYSKVPYKLINSSTKEEISGAVLSVSGDVPAGISLNEAKDAIIIDGSAIENGSFNIKATKGSIETEEKTITVFDGRFYIDAENLNEGALTEQKIFIKRFNGTDIGNVKNGSTGGSVKKEANDNKYFGDEVWNLLYLRLGAVNSSNMGKYGTVTIDVKPGNSHSYNPNLFYEDTSKVKITWNPQNNKLKCGDNECDFVLSSTDWNRISILLDYFKKQYTVFAEASSFGPYAMPNNAAAGQNLFQFQNYVDNIAFYSGTPVNAEIEGVDIPETIAVGSKGAKIALPATADIKIDDITQTEDVIWETTATGVSIDGGYMIVSNTAPEGNITLTATAGNVKKEFTVELATAIEEYETVDALSLGELSKIEATFSGTGVVLQGLETDINLTSSTDNDSKLHIYFDKFKDEYVAICDNKKIVEGKYTSLTNPANIVLQNTATVSSFYAGSIYDEAPMVLDARFSANPVIGQTLSVDYTYFSKLYEKSDDTVFWYLQGEEPIEEDTLSVEKEMLGKTLKASVAVEGGNKTSTVFTDEKVVTDVYAVSKTGDKTIEIQILNIETDNDDFIVGVEWLNGGERAGTTSKKVSIDDAPYAFTASEDIEEIDDARVWLMNLDLTPIAGEKLASGEEITYQSTGREENEFSYENGNILLYDNSKLTSVIVYKPKSEADFGEYYDTFGPSDSTQMPWDAEICYMGVVNADVKLPITTERSGIYLAKAITQSGEESKEFIIGKEKLFTQDKLRTLTKEQFAKVLKLTGGASSDDEDGLIYDNFQNAEPSCVNTLMQAENFNMEKIETAILISAFLKDKNNKNTLTANLSECGFTTEQTKGVELLTKNNDFSKSASLVDLNGGINGTLTSMFETAVLQGIECSGHAIETKTYLSELDGYTISDDVASAFTGAKYDTLAELKAALSGSNTDGGTDSEQGSDNSSDTGIGGATGNSGFVGGGGGGGGVNKLPAEQEKEDGKENQNLPTEGSASFNDVTPTHWAYEDISFLVSKNILNGMGDGSFAPESGITRAEYVKILSAAFPLVEGEDSMEFADVKKDDWYYTYIQKSAAAGIITGDGTNFRPNEKISRQDAAVMLYRLLDSLNVTMEKSENTAADSGDISSYAITAVNTLYGAGILTGMDDGRFLPKSDITRAQAATIVARVLK